MHSWIWSPAAGKTSCFFVGSLLTLTSGSLMQAASPAKTISLMIMTVSVPFGLLLMSPGSDGYGPPCYKSFSLHATLNTT